MTTTGGDVDITATSTATIGGEAVATSVSIGIGGSGAGGESSSIDNIVTQAYLGAGANVSTNGGQLDISSSATPQITAEADGGSAGLVSVGVMESTATLNGATRAYIGEGVMVNAGGVDVSALSTDGSPHAVEATTSLVNIGGVSLGITNGSASIEDTVEAFIGPEANTKATNSLTVITVTGGGTLKVGANSTTTSDVEAPGDVNVGAITVSSTSMTAKADGSTNAYLGGHLTLNVPTADVKAQSTNTATTNATMVGVAAVAASVAQVEAENSRNISSYVAADANVQAPTTALSFESISTENATSNLNGGNGGVISVVVLIQSATVSGSTEAYVDAGAMVTAGSLSVDAEVQAANATDNNFAISLGIAAGAGPKPTRTFRATLKPILAARAQFCTLAAQ